MSRSAHRAPTQPVRVNRSSRRWLGLLIALTTVVMSAGVAFADDVTNDIEATTLGGVTLDRATTSTDPTASNYRASVAFNVVPTRDGTGQTRETSNAVCNIGTSGDSATALVGFTVTNATTGQPSTAVTVQTARGDGRLLFDVCSTAQIAQFSSTVAGVYNVVAGTPTTAGTTTGTWNVAASAFQLTVQAPAPTAAATSLSVTNASGAFDDASVNLTATLTSGSAGVSGKSVSFQVGSTTVGSETTNAQGIATLAYTLDKGVNAGSYSLQASWAGDAIHATSTSASGTLTVNKAAQSITFAQPANGDVGDTFTVTPTATSGLPVAVASMTPTVCTVSGADVTLVGVGTCTLAADQAGNTNWLAAAQVTHSLTASKVAQILGVVFDPEAPTFLGGGVTVTATSSSGLPVTTVVKEGPCTLSGSALSLLGAGYCVVTASQTGTARFEAASQDFSVNIAKATQTITFALPDAKTYGDAPFPLGASTSSGLPLSFGAVGDCTVAGGTVTITGAGTCDVTVSQPGNADYNAATPVTHTIQIAKANQTIEFTTPTGKAFGDPAFALTASASSGLTVSFVQVSGPCTVNGVEVAATGAGNCVVRATQEGNDNFNAAPPVEDTIEFAKASQAINFAQPSGKTYGDVPFALNATSTSSLPVSYAADGDCTVANGMVTITGAGSCDVTASQSGDDNYNAASPVTRTIEIALANQAITFAQPAAKTFRDPSFLLGAVASSGLTVTYTTTGPCTTVEDVLVITGAGTCQVTAAQGGNGNYNPATSVTRSFTIAKANQPALTISTSVAGGYADTIITLGARGGAGEGTVSYSVGASNACTVNGSTLTITKGTGTCAVTATKAGDDNYNPVKSGETSITLAAWKVGGFYSPVDLNGIYNTVKGGSTVPVKFELFAGSRELTAVADAGALSAKPVNCTSAAVDEIEVLVASTNGSGLRYDSTAGQYIYNWKTPAGAGKCYQFTMTARDGSIQTALFKMK